MKARTATRATTSRPGRIRIILAAAWLILSLALGGVVTAESRTTTNPGSDTQATLP